MRIGVRVAIDVGSKRIGVAGCDRDGILASPIGTIQRGEELSETLHRLIEVLPENPFEIYVGLPVNLKAESTKSTEDAIALAEALELLTTAPIRLVDERMTTALANSQLRLIGKSQKDARSTIDQMAAVAILEYALDIEKKQGIEPGLTISEWKAKYE